MMRSYCTVQEQIDDIIQHAAPYFDRLPGVVVINNIAEVHNTLRKGVAVSLRTG